MSHSSKDARRRIGTVVTVLGCVFLALGLYLVWKTVQLFFFDFPVDVGGKPHFQGPSLLPIYSLESAIVLGLPSIAVGIALLAGMQLAAKGAGILLIIYALLFLVIDYLVVFEPGRPAVDEWGDIMLGIRIAIATVMTLLAFGALLYAAKFLRNPDYKAFFENS